MSSMRKRTPRTWGENVWPTAQQLADWLKVCTDNERLTHAEIAIRDAQAYDRLHGLDGHVQAHHAEPEGVGTGAGEGVTGQDTGTTWVTRSADCPEAPAQAHPLASSYATEAVLQSAVLALADDWDDFEHDQITCPKYDCSDCTMKNAVYDLRTCVWSVAALTSEPERGADGGVS